MCVYERGTEGGIVCTRDEGVGRVADVCVREKRKEEAMEVESSASGT